MTFAPRLPAAFLLGLALSIPWSALARGPHSSQRNPRAQALWQLRGCCLSPRTRNCSNEDGLLLVDLARRGDDGVILPIMEVSTCGDPAISTVLAPFLFDLLVTNPRRFVRVVAGVPDAMQAQVVFAAVMFQSELLDPDMKAGVRKALQSLGRGQTPVGRAARRCLDEFNRIATDG